MPEPMTIALLWLPASMLALLVSIVPVLGLVVVTMELKEEIFK